MSRADCHLVKRALTRREAECGDTGVIKEVDGRCFLALVDVLGHGREAHAVAVTAQTYLEQNCFKEPVEVMRGLHTCLKGTRGAVAAICRLDIAAGELVYAGMGNIVVRVLGPRAVRLVSRDGVVGYIMSTPKQQTVKLLAGDVLVMHSDGIKEHFELSGRPDILSGTAESIATALLDQFWKQNDDASCIVLKYLGG